MVSTVIYLCLAILLRQVLAIIGGLIFPRRLAR
jgi:polar amino acid transport system permease protein